MKKKFISRVLAALPVAMACVSCAVALEPDFPHYSTRGRNWAQRLPANTMAVTASVEQPSDGTNTGTVKWKAGDKIRIFNTTNPEGVEFTLEEACDGLTVGTFMGEVLSGAGPFYAVYPSCVAGSLNGEEVDIVVPQKQELVSGSFGNPANIAFAKVEDLSQKFPFRNVLGAVKVSLSSHIGAACVRIETKADESLWGPATVCMAGGIPSLTFTKPQPSRQIVEASGNATGKDFYVMVPPGTLADGFILQVSDGWNDTMLQSASASENNRVVRFGVCAPGPVGLLKPDSGLAHQPHLRLLRRHRGGRNPGSLFHLQQGYRLLRRYSRGGRIPYLPYAGLLCRKDVSVCGTCPPGTWRQLRYHHR